MYPSADPVRSFRLLDLTLPSAVENLALDEALLDDLEDHGGDPVLRFWESARPVVVLGRAANLTDDVHITACVQDGVPVLRRASGGGTVLQGPGCLSYALVLPLAWHPDLTTIRSTYHFILTRIAHALHRWQPAVAFRGISDLAIDGRKVSGNAQRRKRHTILFHGTILYAMQAELIARYLNEPKRQPDYREGRPHDAFLRTVAALPQDIKQALAEAWDARKPLDAWPRDRMASTIASVLERSPEWPGADTSVT
jgi:lipoate---protein ligase